MIFDKKPNFKQLDIDQLSENVVKDITKLNTFIMNKDSTTSYIEEYYDYIDNLILYFNGRKTAIMHLGKQQIENIYTNRKTLIKGLNSTDNWNNIILNKPNFKYYKFPMIEKLMYNNIMSTWTLNNNDILPSFMNCYSPIYNKIVADLTNNEVKAVARINDLIKVITDKHTFKSKKELISYMNTLMIPRDDLDNINKFIETYITSLKELKTTSVNNIQGQNKDTDFDNKVLYAIKMIDIKTMYVKNAINILLNIYMVKLSVFNFNPSDNKIVIDESLDFTSILIDKRYYKEAEIYLNEGFSEQLYVTNDINKETLLIVKDYLDKIYKSTLMYIDKYYYVNSSAISNYIGLFNFTNIDEILKTVDCIYNMNYDNIERYVQTHNNRDYSKFTTNGIFLDKNKEHDREMLEKYFCNKEKIKQSFEYDYNKIIAWIEQLLNNKVQLRTKLFDRFYDELPIYAKSESENICEYIYSKYGINIQGIEIDISYKARIMREIDNKYGHNVDIIKNIERYMYLDKQYKNMMFITSEFDKQLEKNKYIDDILLAYMIHFQNKSAMVSFL